MNEANEREVILPNIKGTQLKFGENDLTITNFLNEAQGSKLNKNFYSNSKEMINYADVREGGWGDFFTSTKMNK